MNQALYSKDYMLYLKFLEFQVKENEKQILI